MRGIKVWVKNFWEGFRSARFVGRDGFLRTVSVLGKIFWILFGLTDFGGAKFLLPCRGNDEDLGYGQKMPSVTDGKILVGWFLRDGWIFGKTFSSPCCRSRGRCQKRFSRDAFRRGKMFLGGWNCDEGMAGGYLPVIILFGFRGSEAQGREAEVFLGKMDV